jgi:hypothetical protein
MHCLGSGFVAVTVFVLGNGVAVIILRFNIVLFVCFDKDVICLVLGLKVVRLILAASLSITER